MTFGQILARGTAAAHRSIPAWILLFLLYGTYQAGSLVGTGLLTTDPTAMQPVQPGQSLPPEYVIAMGFAGLSCAWLVVMVFVGPFVTGGTVGQLRDHVRQSGDVPGSFTGFGARFYLQLLGLTLIFGLIAVLFLVILGLLAVAITFEQLGGMMMMQPEQMQELQTHPVMIATNLLNGLFVVTLFFVYVLSDCIVVIEYTDPFTAIGRAFGFIWRRPGDASRLWAINTVLVVPMWCASWMVQIFQIHSLPVLLVAGILLGLYVPYVMLLVLAWTVSLWLARSESAEEGRSANDPGRNDASPEGLNQPLTDSAI